MPILFDPPFKALDSGLVLYVPLWAGELSGASFNSKDRNRHPITVTGALWTPQGRRFDGDDYLDLGTITILPDGVGTVSVWVKLTGTDYTFPGDHNYLVAKGRDDGLANNPWGVFIVDDSSSDVTLALLYAGGTVSIAGVSFTRDTWYLYTAVMRDDNTQELFLDTSSQTTGSRTTTGPLASLGFRIGNQERPAPYDYATVGIIGDVTIYNRALTASEIQRLYLATKWRYK